MSHNFEVVRADMSKPQKGGSYTMPATPGSYPTQEEADGREEAVRHQPERITVALIRQSADDLQHLQDKTSLSKTDLVNRAITLYEFIDSQLRSGQDLILKDRKTGETQLVWFL
jgi:hypothetical protein